MPAAVNNGPRVRNLASRRHLAECLRIGIHEDWIRQWMEEVIMGRDPRVTMRDWDPKTGKPRQGKPSTAKMAEQLPSLELSAEMFKLMLLRRDGAPAQQIQLDQDLRARTLNVDAHVDVNQLASMNPEQRLELLRTLRPLMISSSSSPGTSSSDRSSGSVASSQELVEAARAGAAAGVQFALAPPQSDEDDANNDDEQ